MHLLLHLVAKDLRRKARSPLGFIAALSFPLLFAGMIALVFGRGGEGMPRVRLLVDNADEGLLGSGVASVFTSRQASSIFDGQLVDAERGRVLMEQGQASALLTIPSGFTRDVLDGKPVTLRLLRNPAEGILPEIAEQTVGALTDILDGGRRVFDRPLAEMRPLFEDEGGAPTDAEVIAISLAVKRAIESTSSLLYPPAIVLESELFSNVTAKAVSETRPSGQAQSAVFLLVLPGVAVYGLFLIADQGMRDVMTERTLGTLKRQLAGPLRPAVVILGKAAFTAVLAGAAIVVLAAVGAAVLTAKVSVPAFLLVSGTLVLAVTGTASVVYGLARTERQASTLGNMLWIAMGFLGGGFIRIEGLPQAMRAIAPLTPLYWGTTGYRAVLESGAGVAEVAAHAAVLAAMGLALLGIGAMAMRRSTGRGAGT